ncbi:MULTISPECIES: phage tail protein [Catenuloplanes]|uniref:Phage tail-like protein n=1 Tax=Catenuloplanes niger TaxID=587534 RepID=A0AAE4A0F6_9ACTN|nr:phage tail protein [Catenuloplanes niger]MDR7327323.1 phage tail-like protein [Catenuloplanes niger]
MSCGTTGPTFRLLDAHVGWDPEEGGAAGLAGLTDPGGLRLARLGTDPDAPGRPDLLPWFPDPRLAPGGAPGSWFLLTPGGLRRRAACGTGFVPALRATGDAVAYAGHWLAIAGADGVRLWWRDGEHLIAVLPVRGARLVTLAPDGAGAVLTDGGVLRRFAPGGAPAGRVETGLRDPIVGLRAGRHGELWLLTDDDGTPRLWRSRHGGAPRPATIAELAAALPRSALTAAWDGGFCLREPGADGIAADRCYDWDGCELDGPPPPVADRHTDGELRTEAVDGGLSRCRWHRVSLDVDLPAGTSVRIAVAVTEAGPEEPAPDAADWQTAPAGATDFLIDQPPGRYLRLRLALAGDGTNTPVVRRVRLDFPRVTSAELLPAAFRQDPAADDFTERFLSLFDTTLAGIDRVIDRYPALLDADGVPDAALPWLGELLGLGFDSAWDADVRRRLLAAAPELYRRRGTPWALQEVIRIVTGVRPHLAESARERAWLGLGGPGTAPRGALGAGRLFGRSAARFRLGTSALDTAPLHSTGDPHADPLAEHAYRFQVVVPAPVAAGPVRELVAAHAPAHTLGAVRTGGTGWVVGVASAVGVDTGFTVLPPPVTGRARLGGDAVLADGRRGPHRGITVGERATVGADTVAF